SQVRGRRTGGRRVPRPGPPADARRAPGGAPVSVNAPGAPRAGRCRPPAGARDAEAPRGLRVPPPAPPVAPPRPGATAGLPAGHGARARAARAGGGRGERPRPPRATPRGGGVRARGVFSDRGCLVERRRSDVSEPERFYLVDGPSYLYRAYHAIGHLSTSR